MSLSKETLKQIVEAGAFGFSDEQKKTIYKIISKELNNLTGKTFHAHSGGGCLHFFFQLKDLRWVGFHNAYMIEKPSITSKPFKTWKSLETAFYEQEEDVTDEEFLKERVSKKEYEKALKVVKLYEAQRK